MISDKYIANFKPNSAVSADCLTPEHISCLNLDLMDVLKPAYNDLGKLLLTAAKTCDSSSVESLLSRGAPFSTDWLGTSPLHFAAKNNDVETCRILLENGISKDAKTKVDRTPLHLAAYEGNIEIVQMLIANKCDIDSKDMLKMTPLHWAIENKHNEIVEELLKHGANPSICSKFGKTPITLAREQGDMELYKALVAANHRHVTEKQTEAATESLMHELQQQKQKNIGRDTMQNGNDDDDNTRFSIDNSNTVDIDDYDDDNVIEDSDSCSNIERDDSFSLSDALIQFNANAKTSNNMQKSLQILKDHGISMSEDEPENNLIASALQSGRKIVLSEAGKFLFNNDNGKTQNNLPLTPANKQIVHPATHQNLQRLQAQQKQQQQQRSQPQKMHTIQTISPGKQNKYIKIVSASQFKQMYKNDNIKRVAPQEYLQSSNGDSIKRKQPPTTIASTSPIKRIALTNNGRTDISTANRSLPNAHFKNFVNEQTKKQEYIKRLPNLPQGTILTIAKDGSFTQNSATTKLAENNANKKSNMVNSIKSSMSIAGIERQLLELRKENEELRKQFELSRKESEGYRKRLEKLEKDNEMFLSGRINVIENNNLNLVE